MEIKPWYVHGINYSVKENKYLIETSEPLPSLDSAIATKAEWQAKHKFGLIEINQKPTMELPSLS